MSRNVRRHLEATAEEYLRTGRVNQCLATYRRLGEHRRYAARLRDTGNASLLHGDSKTAISAFVIAGYLDLPVHRHAS